VQISEIRGLATDFALAVLNTSDALSGQNPVPVPVFHIKLSAVT